MTLLGHVKNGVIVLDAEVKLDEGTAVRVEPLVGDAEAERAARYRLLLQRLEEWNKEDVTDEILQEELSAEKGIRFRDGGELERILNDPIP